MSPHGIVMLSAFLLGVAGKASFPHSSIRVAIGSVVLIHLGLAAYVRGWPSPLGFSLITVGSLVGAVIGVVTVKLANRFLKR